MDFPAGSGPDTVGGTQRNPIGSVRGPSNLRHRLLVRHVLALGPESKPDGGDDRVLVTPGPELLCLLLVVGVNRMAAKTVYW